MGCQLDSCCIMGPLFILILGVLAQRSEACEPTPVTPPPPPGTTPPPPQPCVWAEWSTWSICSAACGGTPCSGDVTKVQDCNVDVCPTCDVPSDDSTTKNPHSWLQNAFDEAAKEQEGN